MFLANYQLFCMLTKPWSGLMSLSSELPHDPVSHFKAVQPLTHLMCQVNHVCIDSRAMQRALYTRAGNIDNVIFYEGL